MFWKDFVIWGQDRMDKVIISGKPAGGNVCVLRIHIMWARPCGGNGVCVDDS